MTRAQAASASHSGACDDDVAALRLVASIRRQLDKLDPDTVARELSEYGAWDASELADHDANLSRLLWLAACDLDDMANA